MSLSVAFEVEDVKLRVSPEVPYRYLEWHVGEKVSEFWREQVWQLKFKPVYVQADGDELDWVVKNTVNFPLILKPVVRWFNPHASMIFDLLPIDWGKK